MNATFMAIGMLLVAQVGNPGDSYPPPRGGQPDGTTGSNLVPIGSVPSNTPAPMGNRSNRNSANNSSGNSANNSGQNPLNATPHVGAGTVPSNAQFQPPPNNFQQFPQQPSYPGDEAAGGQTGNGPKPSTLMQAMLAPPPGSQLRGEPVRLIDVVSTGQNRNAQTQRIEAYWDLCSSVADYYLALRELDEFRELAPSVSRPGPAWQQADKDLAVRIETALHAARASQFRLAGFIGRGPNNLPLPADMPHCGSYVTRYEQNFAGRSSPEAQELAVLLAARYAELANTAADLANAKDLLSGSVRNGGSDGNAGVQAFELLALRRRAFVQLARDYNRRIARYTELSTPGEIGADRLTSMLIKRSTVPTATRSDSAEPPRARSSRFTEPAAPHTFAANDWISASPIKGVTGQKNQAVEPASATEERPRVERSLLAAPIRQ